MHIDLPNAPAMYLLPGIIDDKIRTVTPILVSSYKDCAPTFGVLTDEGALYVDVPSSHLVKQQLLPELPLHRLVYRDCPSADVWGGRLDHFRTLEVARLFDREGAPMARARYLLTLDWPRDNWMSHVFLATDGPVVGRLLIWPHTRVLWGADAGPILPTGFRKVRETWRVGPIERGVPVKLVLP